MLNKKSSGLMLPSDIEEILDGLSSSQSDRLKEYIESLQSKIVELGGNPVSSPFAPPAAEDDTTTAMDTETEDVQMKDDIPVDDDDKDNDFVVPQYSNGEDYDAQGEYKMKASDAKNEGNFEVALDFFNQAIQAAPPSALLYANRAMVLEKLGHYKAAENDCNLALEQNPDSAKALKVRGTLRYQHWKDWEGALSDLSQAQTIDYDPDLTSTLEELTKLRIQKEREDAQERIEKEEKLKKKAEEIKKAQQEAKQESTASASAGRQSAGGMPGMPGGGMPGMPDMSAMMNDPEIIELMKNPKVVAAFQDLMSGPGGPMALLSNPQKLQQMMTDPEVGPALQKIMSKFMGGGGGMPGMGGMGGGGGGAPGFGGAAATGGNEDGDAIPDMDDLPELD